ncbi:MULTISPECIES: membrane protein insertion efficiency factor YidD [unclassified Sulfurospirillum]|uniref:membrane protein insertion efficiency factor YidD n=1 Tax=unclassified Sulfurospirillum TaxID=2618290 RepID=UPI000502C0B3|nr:MULTISPECIES: membrane protein insertion efficiency factor YidD [unclassified Sulfurospirillum]KFL33691.1 membrane protein insertion efficiency factor [Sulfurospirillum sp. SCADC]
MKSFALLLIKLYQKFFTLIGYGSCRYYPTCSQYAKEQLLHNSFLKAIFYSFMRILRCNQLFAGGIDYPVVTKKFASPLPLSLKHSRTHRITFWFVPKDKQSFYLIRAFKTTK